MIKRVGSVAALGLALVVAACGSSSNDDKGNTSSSDGGDVAFRVAIKDGKVSLTARAMKGID